MDVTIRGIGRDQVEIIVPRAKQEDVDRCKRILTSVGSLEFRILANRRDHASIIADAEATFPLPLKEGGKVRARWLPPAASAGPITEHGEIVVKSDAEHKPRVLVVQDDLDVTGELLRRAESTVDEMGQPAVGFHFQAKGARLFGTLTETNRPDPDGFERRLAVVLDGEICSAPSIRDRITENGVITGNFRQEEVDDLAAILNAGSLPASLQPAPASELSIGPTLGRDTVQSGMTAMIVSTAVVLLFMLAYYRLAGMIANLAVLMNVLIVVGAMSWLHATWTLPGLAGLALSVGMAVDANVLIFERLREEQEKSRSIRQAIESAFHRALRPILDSNATTFLAGAILYWIGSDQIKGFALTLLIGLAANLFTAVFVCRLVFDILERNAWVRRFGMTRMFKNTAFDFVGKRWFAVGASSLMILVGMAAAAVCGKSLLDIDFTGGTLAAVRFEKPIDSAGVRAMAGEAIPDVAVEELQLSGEPLGHHFLVRTTLADQEVVKTRLMRRFDGRLVATRVNVDSVAPIPAAEKQNGNTPAVPAFTEGSRVMLSLNQPAKLSAIDACLEDYLAKQGLTPVDQYYRIAPKETPGASTSTHVQLQTSLQGDALRQMLDALRDEMARTTVFERLENFGGQVAGQTQVTAALAMLLGMLSIVVYLWIRFQNVLFGLGAVVALVHDVLVVLGLIAVSHWLVGTWIGDWLAIESFKINLPMIAALLTLVGYSVNDTIVVFDRIRESRRKSQPITWEIVNTAVNQTLSRTILTGLTTWIVALILYGFGGAAIHGFAFCLVIGILVGTYSSVYIASPILVWLSPAGGTLPREFKPASVTGDQTPGQGATQSGQGPKHPRGGRGKRRNAA
jgi:SecD/SecF fusion protein